MKKINLLIIGIIVVSTCFLSGCNEGTTTEDTLSNKIQMQSDLVRLVYAKFIPKTDNEKIVSIDVEYLLKNIAGRVVSIMINAEFYDSENNLLYTSEQKPFTNIPADYVETEISPFNVITYDGNDANKVDHVKLIVEEYFGT